MMDKDKGLAYWFTHPGAMLGAVATVLASSLDLVEPVLTFLTASVQTWFPLLSTLTSIADLVPALPKGLFEQLFLTGAVIYATILLYQLVTESPDK